MKILVYESLCAGGLGESPPASLRAEGWAMLRAIAGDLGKVADVSTLLTPELPEIAGVRCERTSIAESNSRFFDLIRAHDAVLPIAPEIGGILELIADQIIFTGRALLGCRPNVIRLTADKWELAQHWRSRGVPTPVTRLMNEGDPLVFPVVLKPRDGAGSQATRLVMSAAEWPRIKAEAESERDFAGFIVQPFASGMACSVSFLIGPRQTVALMPAEQTLSPDGHFRYLGGRMPVSADLAERAVTLATAALAGIDGLSGYVGVDLVLGDGGADVAIEINPRMTTSYVGLRELCRQNLAEAWLRLADGADDLDFTWEVRPLSFRADGKAGAR